MRKHAEMVNRHYLWGQIPIWWASSLSLLLCWLLKPMFLSLKLAFIHVILYCWIFPNNINPILSSLYASSLSVGGWKLHAFSVRSLQLLAVFGLCPCVLLFLKRGLQGHFFFSLTLLLIPSLRLGKETGAGWYKTRRCQDPSSCFGYHGECTSLIFDWSVYKLLNYWAVWILVNKIYTIA